jgi:hypothetical protein
MNATDAAGAGLLCQWLKALPADFLVPDRDRAVGNPPKWGELQIDLLTLRRALTTLRVPTKRRVQVAIPLDSLKKKQASGRALQRSPRLG